MKNLRSSDDLLENYNSYNTSQRALSGENLMAALHRLNFDNYTEIKDIELSKLEEIDIPCIAALKSGTGIIITGIFEKELQIQ